MAPRSRMTMRAYVQRNGASVNSYGHKSTPSWAALATVACYVWNRRADAEHDASLSKDLTYYRAIMPLGTDVTSDDRINKVEDRAGNQLFGRLSIDAIMRRTNHLELRLRNVE